MAHEDDDVALAHRLLSIGAVALLASAAALAFARVFQGDMATLKLLGAAVLSVIVAALLERRGPILAVIGSAAGFLIVAGLFVYPKTMFAIFPTLDTFKAFGHAIDKVGHQASVQVAPTPPLPPLLLAAITAVWTASFAAHALAIRAGSPLLAVLPPAALLAFADVLLDDGARPGYAALFLMAALTVLFMDGLRRVRQWGPLRPWPGHRGRARLASTTATRGARRVTVFALAAALLVPGLLPGFQSPALLKIDTTNVLSSPTVDPLVSVTASLKRHANEDLFLIKAEEPSYWRWLALDHFDGTKWTTTDLDVEHGQQVSAGDTLPTSSLATARAKVKTTSLFQTVLVLANTDDPWLPMAYQPETVAVGRSSIHYDSERTSAVPDVGVQQGLEYTVRSELEEPTQAQLDSVSASDMADPSYLPYKQLPADTPTGIYNIAHRLASGEDTPFSQVLAIMNYLRTFKYDIHVSGASDTKDLLNFLTHTQRGFCQQFATAMAVLVRALGYPARVAVGFTQGRYDKEQRGFRVSTENAHAWVEVLFPGFGWTAFEPTPTRNNPVADVYLSPEQEVGTHCFVQGTCPGGTPAGGGTSGSKLAKAGGLAGGQLEQGQTHRGGALRVGRSGRAPSHPYRFPVVPVLIVLALLLLAALILTPIVKTMGRRARVVRAASPRQVVLAAYRSFTSSAADLGLGRSPGETLREHRDRLRTEVRFSDGHLDRLTSAAGQAAYSELDVSRDEAREAVSDARRALRDMRRSTSAGRRLLGVFRPGL